MSLLVAKTKEQIKNTIISAVNKAISENILESADLPDFAVELLLSVQQGLPFCLRIL